MKALFAGLVVLLLHLQPSAAADRPLLVFAAASLAEVMADASDGFTRAGGATPKVSLAGSGTLARQIIAGAPATLFISAHPKWVSEVDKAGRPAARRRWPAGDRRSGKCAGRPVCP